MENASKALIIAGGILIGMITISIFYFMFNQISEYQSVSQIDYTQEELIAFNQGFESYNKKLMYGSDVISVINKAVDNNTKHGVVAEPANEYYMDISVKLNQQLYMRIEKYEKKSNNVYDKTANDTQTVLNKEFQISNSEQYGNILNYLVNGDKMKDVDGKPQYNTDKSRYTITYYPVTEFKRLTFRCSGTNYDKVSGRIKYMEFTQYQ